MLRVRDRRVRIVLAVVLLLAIAMASYQIGVTVWSSQEYHAACQALERYDFLRAGEHLTKYLSFHPTDPTALLLAAQTARRRGEFEEEARHLRLIVRSQPPFCRLRHRLCRCR